ncbi:ATP-binding protein [Variovorax sp. LT1R16]|uniref:ATP-binding protein n=1 Tax=Variovorax sp. LT1R16 TaxID=3443728 RepID=UPI003F451DBB
MEPFLFGRFELRADERQLWKDGRAVPIGARALDVLLALVQRRDRVVGKEELMATAWPGLVVEDNNLTVQVSSLRKLLGAKAIATVPGRGYRFTAERVVREGEGAATPMATATAVPSTVPGNLAAALPPLYGRADDTAAVLAACNGARLVTLCGAGGIGKTSLAAAVARDLAPRCLHGGWIVELAAVRDPAMVVPAVAECLSITLPGHAAALQELANALQTRQLLLVLDNCEHMLGAVAPLAHLLLRVAPGVRLLATSQEPLRVVGENVHRLAPLSVPAPTELATAERFGAVHLFIERVRAQQAGFRPVGAELADVVEICRHLDGIPLALELAAARVPLLGVAGVRSRLGERLHLLTRGTRIALDRHQTLHAALAWSYQLMVPETQSMLRRLGVFTGGFSLEGAQRVAGDANGQKIDVIEQLGLLVDRSLLTIEPGARPRYRMLESMRMFALEQLEAAGEAEATARRHAQAMSEICGLAVRQRDSAWLWAEMNNARIALTWAVGRPGEGIVAVTIATHIAVLLATAGPVPEAMHYLVRVRHLLDAETPPALAARYWQWMGRLGIDGRMPSSQCIEALERAASMFRSLGDHRHVHACHRMIAEAFMHTGDLASATEQLACAERLESRASAPADRMRRLRIAGLLADAAGDHPAALQLAQQALVIAEAQRIHRYRLMLMADMAWVELCMDRPNAAAAQLQDLLRLIEPSPREGLTRAYALAGLTASLTAAGRLEEARAGAPRTIDALRASGMLLARGDIFSWLALASGHPHVAAQVMGATDRFHEQGETRRDRVSRHAQAETLRGLEVALASTDVAFWAAQGRQADEAALARLLEDALATGPIPPIAPMAWDI